MAVRYKADNEDLPPLSPAPVALPSPESQATSSSMASPPPSTSPLPYVTLAEQTFTPLSMDISDFALSDNAQARASEGRGKDLPVGAEADRLLGTAGSMEHMKSDGVVGSSSSSSGSTTVPAGTPVGRGATIVSAMVQSFEALHAATTAGRGHELLSAKHQGHRPPRLVSPPSTLSPSPSLSRSPSPSPVGQKPPTLEEPGKSSTEEDGLGTRQDKSVEAQVEDTTVPQSGAATANPTPSALSSSLLQAQSPSGQPLDPSPPSSQPQTTVVADTTLIRPTPSTRPSENRNRGSSNPTRPPLVCTSLTASVAISHPTPDANKRSQAGGFLGNIAALEATAERLSMTSSIEDAIRDEHNELKRSESRRSSVLQANRARAASTSDSHVASRRNSILDTNSTARLGGYSPGAFVMSPHHSLSTGSVVRRPSTRDADGAGLPVDADNSEEYRFLPRHGPGKASTRSVASKLSLVQIAELEHPAALTQEVLDEADRAAAAGEEHDDDETIKASAHQFIDAEFADAAGGLQPMLNRVPPAEPSPRLQLHQPDDYRHYGAPRGYDDRPTTSGSGTTFEQAQAAFGDFDGVHCDPEAGSDSARSRSPEFRDSHTQPQVTPPRPKSYLDPATGQQMLYYPAPVPAMLNLPPKLSKKPKAALQNMRRSRVVAANPRAARESRSWLPDPTEGLHEGQTDASFMGELLAGEPSSQTSNPDTKSQSSGMGGGVQTNVDASHARQPSEASTAQLTHTEPQRGICQPQRLTDADNRKSLAATMDGLPPQLRASVFFDLPPTVPKIEVTGGSATATLESILDASTAAPVNAFTDHPFAGRVGAEVYGPEKKKKAKKPAHAPTPAPAPEEKSANKRKTLVKRNSSSNLLDAEGKSSNKRKTLVKRNSSSDLLDAEGKSANKRKTLVKRNSTSNLLDIPSGHKKRASRFSLFGGKRGDDDESDNDPTEAENIRDGVGSRNGTDEEPEEEENMEEEEQEEEEEEEEDDSEEEEEIYEGPPTTLLAELQRRKQKNRLRTRPITHAYPNGMHTTLLELDAVAEVERKARKGKRVNLAWEDPAASADAEEEDDEDVPLGMLYVAKAAGSTTGGNRSTMDISALMSEVHRPLGLMERREMEDNEPLSRRRDRLQGKETAQLPLSLSVIQKRLSHMPLTGGPAGLGLRSQSRLAVPLHAAGGSGSGSRAGSAAGEDAEDSEPEVEGESLAARKARLAAKNPLPRARPVSGTFSAELLSQFGADEERPASADSKAKSKGPAHSRNASAISGKENIASAGMPEEEETLGQRRRRLQQEREAREREMAAGLLLQPPTTMTMMNGNPANRPSRPLSMAAMLGAYPREPQQGAVDPRQQERLRREAEAARVQQEKDAKMAAMRAQMPTFLTAPNVGARQGGYMGGRFNDGLGGSAVGGSLGYAGGPHLVSGMQQQQQPEMQRASTFLGSSPYGGGGVGMMGLGAAPYGSTPNLAVYAGGMPMGPAASTNGGLPGYGGYGGAVQMPGAQGHIDMVERWRQGVLP
ncbi:hypothetical protein VTK56DRAFT_1171 [Thermocarpiscus australiensis]